jgi:S1-C subfamily serine protease
MAYGKLSGMSSDDDAFRPTAEDLRAAEQRRRNPPPPPRPAPSGPVHHPQLAAQYGPQQGPGLSGNQAARPHREPPRATPRPSPPPVLAAAFGRPNGADGFAPPDGARTTARPVPDSPWWKPDAPRDPWRDPESPAYLAGPPDLNGKRPSPAAEDEDAEGEDAGAGKRRRGLGLRQLSLTASIVLLIAALIVGVAGGATGFILAHRYGLDSLFSPGSDLTKVTPSISRPPGSVSDIANRVLPAVVSIEVRNGEEYDVGSGVVVDAKGYIITNNHVVSAAADGKGTVRVIFADQSSVIARIVGRDPKTDLAVIKVERGGMVVATLGDSAALQVGDPVIAIGSPLGLANTVTLGIVSSLHRPVPLQGEGTDTDAVIDAVQTDAAINPGNSGGALVDGSGAVVGINTAIATLSTGSGQSGSIGVGFAIPINEAREISQQLIRTGSVKHATLSVNTRSVTKLNGSQDGALVESVSSGGAGDQAGLQEKDVITKVDDTIITGSDKLVVTVRAHKVGDKVKITYVRGGDTKTVEATLQSD